MVRAVSIVICCVFLSCCTAAVCFAEDIKYHGDKQELLYEMYSEAEKTDNRQIAATVNGEPIYKDTVEIALLTNRIGVKNAAAALEENGEDPSLYDFDALKYECYQTILDDLIRERVVKQEAERSEISVDYREAYDALKETFEILEENPDDESTKALERYKKAVGLSDEEYFERTVEAYRSQLMITRLYENFAETVDGTSFDAERAYEEYVLNLIKEAEIIYR